MKEVKENTKYSTYELQTFGVRANTRNAIVEEVHGEWVRIQISFRVVRLKFRVSVEVHMYIMTSGVT